MLVEKFEPIEPLKKAVDYIWVVTSEALSKTKQEDIIMPLGHVNMILNYGSEYMVLENESYRKLPNVAIIGQIKRAKHIRYGQSIYQIGIALHGIGFMILFGIPSIKITEQIINISDDYLGLESVYQNVRDIKEVEKKVQYINQYLLRKMHLNLWNSGLVEKMVGYIENNCEQLNILKMANNFHMSVSTLERTFKKYIGLTPKRYGDILKFRKNIENKSQMNSMKDLYYDQSHFLKHSKKYAGKTVSELEDVKSEITLHYIIQGKSL